MVFSIAYVSKVGDWAYMVIVFVICDYWWCGVMIHFLNVCMILCPEGWRGVLQVEGSHLNGELRYRGHVIVTRCHIIHQRVLSTESWCSILGVLERIIIHLIEALLFNHLLRWSFVQVPISERESCLLGYLRDVSLLHWVSIPAG